ncbi:MAG: hypothetical protein KC713_06850, partial [Candidatus Omnitrophica bacterium]|nr:hypothetical protein [Candidatus Omnitrophota bacterium]
DSGSTIGFYTINVADAPKYNSLPSVWVRSRGDSARLRDTGEFVNAPRTILARVIILSPTYFFASSLGDITIGSGSTFDGNILGRDIYFNVNESINPEEARHINIDGEVFYFRSINGAENAEYVHINSDENPYGQQSPAISFPGVDLGYYRELANGANPENPLPGRYIDGNFNYSGEINKENLGTQNGIVYAEGDITISGEFSDNITFVAGGDIYIDGDLVNGSDSDQFVPQLGLLASENVYISESADSDLSIEAFVMADEGTFEALGPKFSKGSLDFYGAISVRGREGVTGIDLLVYDQRNYTYNSQLASNGQIPFLPNIANVVQWKEITIHEEFPPPND